MQLKFISQVSPALHTFHFGPPHIFPSLTRLRLIHRIDTLEFSHVSTGAVEAPQSWRPPRHPHVHGLDALWSHITSEGATVSAVGAGLASDRSAGSTMSASEWPDELLVS